TGLAAQDLMGILDAFPNRFIGRFTRVDSPQTGLIGRVDLARRGSSAHAQDGIEISRFLVHRSSGFGRLTPADQNSKLTTMAVILSYPPAAIAASYNLSADSWAVVARLMMSAIVSELTSPHSPSLHSNSLPPIGSSMANVSAVNAP